MPGKGGAATKPPKLGFESPPSNQPRSPVTMGRMKPTIIMPSKDGPKTTSDWHIIYIALSTS